MQKLPNILQLKQLRWHMLIGTLFSARPISSEGPKSASGPLFVSSTTGMIVGDTIQIMLDSGELFTTTISQIPVFGQIRISKPLPFRATAGNIVIDLTQSKNVLPDNEDFLT